MSHLLTKWLDHYDPIYHGRSPRGWATGTCITNGSGFPRVAGGYHLYRTATGASAADAAIPIGAAGANAGQVRTFTWRPLLANAVHTITLRAVGGGGVESHPGNRTVTIEVDATGAPEPLRPNPPQNLSAAPLNDGRFCLRWWYTAHDQPELPVRFDVFAGFTPAEILVNPPIGQTDFLPGGGEFRFVTAPYDHDTRVYFTVRTVAHSGADDGNDRTVGARSDAVAPAIPAAIAIPLPAEN